MLNYGNYHGKCMRINTNYTRYNRQLYDYGVFIRPPKYKYLSACMPACLPSAAVSLAWGVLDGDCGLVWDFLSWRGGLAGGPGDAHSGVGSPTWVFDPVCGRGPPRASSQPLSAPTIRGWCFAAHSHIFSASRRHSRPAMTRNPNQPYSPSTPLVGCLGGCSTFTHTWPGLVLVCALFVIKYLCRFPEIAQASSSLLVGCCNHPHDHHHSVIRLFLRFTINTTLCNSQLVVILTVPQC